MPTIPLEPYRVFTGAVFVPQEGSFKGAMYFKPDGGLIWKDPGGPEYHGLVISGDKSGLSDGLRVKIETRWGGPTRSILVAHIIRDPPAPPSV